MRIRWLLCCAFVAAPLGEAAPLMDTGADTPVSLELPALQGKASLELRPNQIGVSRKLEVEALPAITDASLRWRAAGGGYAAAMRVSSPGASGLRVGMRFDAMPPDMEIRVSGELPDGSLATAGVATSAAMTKLARGIWPLEHWTATTEGAVQVIELRSPRVPASAQLRFTLFDVSHLLQKVLDPVRPKALEFACHVDVSCVADADVRSDSRAVARMLFVSDGGSFLCTGSLLKDRVSSGTPLFATANHCIHTQASASSLETYWFYYPATCGGPAQLAPPLRGGGALLFADMDTDFALLRLANPAPLGATFLAWDPTPLNSGQAVFGLHHPDGSFQRYSSGNFFGFARIRDSDTNVLLGQPFSRVAFTQGIVEGGSSGSPILTTPGSFRGTLFGSPDSNSCASSPTYAYYSDFSTVYPLVSGFLAGPNAGDDHGDSPAAATPLNPAAQLVGEINSTSDEDWFRIVFPSAGAWTVASFDASPGTSVDVRGEVYAADGASLLASNDDRTQGDVNFSLSIAINGPVTLYLRVTGGPGIVGHYGLRSTFLPPDEHGDTPATASPLAINGAGGGALGSATDQDWFRLAFDGPGTFHVGSTGATDTIGRLYRADGISLIVENDDENPPDTNFGITATVAAATTLYLQVTGWEGSTGDYGLRTTFTPGIAAINYTDLWGNPSEAGWGVTINHQSDTLFAALFTYAADGRDMWLFASSLPRQPDGTYSGPLYRSAGPAFNASPSTGITVTQVGTMTFAFTGNNQGTLTYSVNGVSVTKAIRRNVYGSPVPTCIFTTGPRSGATNFQDLWASPDPLQAGWGLNLSHQGNVVFAALYTYAADNRAMWLFASDLRQQASGSFSGSLYRATGPAFDSTPWSAITPTVVGTMTLTFTSGNAGTLAYTVNGTPVSRAIQRNVFAAQLPLCQ